MTARSAQEAIDEFVTAIAEHYSSVQQRSGDGPELMQDEFVSSIEHDLVATLRDRLSELDTVREVEGTPTGEMSAAAFADDVGLADPAQPDLTMDTSVDLDAITSVRAGVTSNGEQGASPIVEKANDDAVSEYDQIGDTLDGITDPSTDHSDFEAPTMDGAASHSPTARPSVRRGKSSGAADLSFDGPKVAAARAKKKNLKDPNPPEGYEILSTLGKGGMGIVYKAKHVPLNRVVAVKMIISGELATDDQIVRFQREAEAAAHLSHPNIVSVYEVGTHKGLPYFSLEFVDGPCLSDLMRETTLSAKDAAALLIPVARAVQYSHEMGVLHRDLKPQNILLTQDGRPKVADFGLAKRIDNEDANDADKTRAGVILGTPGYMAPEQARCADVGPQTDVYALGCILYYLMTGKPPFNAPTPFETVRQLLLNEPVPPSKMQSGLDKDLETICLKSLEKELPKRYESADIFADELQRFVDGTPIIARPITRYERVQKWCKRNPKIAVLSGLAASLAFIVMIGGPSSAVVIWGQKQEVVEAKIQAEENAERAEENEKRAEQNEVLAVEAKGVAEENAEAASVQEKNAIDALKSMTFVVQRKMAGKTNLVGLREELLTTVRNGLLRMEKNQNNARSHDMISAGIHVRLGDINGEIGRVAKATEEYNKCVEIFKAIEKQGSIPSPEHNWSKIYQLLGDAARAGGDFDAAIKHHEMSLKVRRDWMKSEPGPKTKTMVAVSVGKLGSICRQRGKLDEARKYMVEAVELREEIFEASPNSGRALDEQLGAKMVLAKVLFQQGETEPALALINTAVNGIHDHLDQHPDSLAVRRNAAMFDIELAQMQLFIGDKNESEKNFQSGVSVLEELKKTQPDELGIHYKLEEALYGLSVARQELGQEDEAKEIMQRLVDMRLQSVALDKSNVSNKTRLLIALARAGRVSEGVRLANELSETIDKNDVLHYELACGFSQLAPARAAMEEGAESQDLPSEKMLLDSSIKSLQNVLKGGFGRGADLQFDPDLDPVRETPEFKSIVSIYQKGT